ncbi:MAG: tetratricopeptide repeat protein [Planctomycetaceae bacterium]|nr:tetratricopeptide repeat protein [Planctomycetaceae bacterium]
MRRLSLVLCLLGLSVGCGSETSAPQATQQESTTPAVGSQVAPQPLEELLKQAEQQLRDGDANAAVKTLSVAIVQHPKQAAPYVRRGAILGEAKLLPQAIQDLSQAIVLDPENAKLHNTRGYFYLMLKQYDQAYQDFGDAIARDLQYPQPYNNRGLVMIARQDFAAAVKEFDAAIRIDEKYVDAHNNRGYALLQQEQHEAAIASFTKALEVNPKYLNALNNRGRAYQTLGDFDKAVADFTRAIELDGGNLQYYAHRADVLRAADRLSESRADLEHIARVNGLQQLAAKLKASPRNAELWTSRGELLTEDGQFEEAAKSFENALKVNEKCVDALVGQARLANARQDWKGVVDRCNAALELESSQAALSLRGDAHHALGQLDAAISDYEASRRMDAHVAAAYLKRSEEHKAAGEKEEADADYVRAVSFDPSLGNGEVIPAAAEQPVREPARFPSAEELKQVQSEQSAAAEASTDSEVK